MKIKIPKKLSPFTSKIGKSFIIPRSSLILRAFVTKFEIWEKEKKLLDLSLDIQGSFDFSIFHDLEKRKILIFLKSKNDFFAFHFFVEKKGLFFFIDRSKVGAVQVTLNEKEKLELKKKEKFLLPVEVRMLQVDCKEKLSLKVLKKQDYELIDRRQDLKEIFPIWYSLGQMVPKEKDHYEGTCAYFKKIEEKIKEKDKLQLQRLFLNLYKIAFLPYFAPTLVDRNFQGILDIKEKEIKTKSANVLLTKGYELVRSLFFREEKGLFFILPCLLPMFYTGILKDLKTEIGLVDLEWSKKLLKKMVIYPEKDCILAFELQNSIKSFRVRSGKKDKAHFYRAKEKVPLKSGQIYFLDRFYK